MNPADLHAPQAGWVVDSGLGYAAFLPAPLPPTIAYDADLVLLLSRADAALSELSGLGRNLPNPYLLITPYVRREAVLSSRIEGTRASLSDLLIGEIEPEGESDEVGDLREVRNYIAALEHGVAQLDTLPLSLRLVRELHERLMRGVRGEYATPGEFRRSQNWIGPAGSSPTTAPYVPPPPAEMLTALYAWETFLHERDRLPDLIQCALIHEHFEAIHPFLDGNGRVGRLLITLFLMERGRLSQPLLYLSAYIETHRQDYYDLLQKIRTHGDWASWLRFFLTGILTTAREGVQRAANVMDLRERFREQLRGQQTALALLDQLFSNPYTTVRQAARVLGVSDPTARQAVNLLERQAIIEEITGRTWRKVYVARPILAAIDEPLAGG